MALAPTAESIRRVGLFAGPLLFLLAQIIPLPVLHDAAPDAPLRATLGLALWMAVWWMTEALPLAATSLLPLAVLPISGVSPGAVVASHYFSDIVALFLGGFCLALAMQKAELHRRIAFVVLRLFGARPRRLVLGFVAAAALLSMWVSNTATTLMLIPVAMTVVAGVESAAGRRFGAACLLGIAFGASIGGVGTTIGTPPNAFLQGFYNQHFAAQIAAGELPAITFGRWMVIGVPLVLVLAPACWWLLTRVSPGVPQALAEFTPDEVTARLKPAARLSRSEWLVMLVFFATAGAWITHAPIQIGGVTLPLTGWDLWLRFDGKASFLTDGTIAIVAALLLFILPGARAAGAQGRAERLLTWEFAVPRLPWGALLLFGGGLALAAAFDAGGLSAYLKALFGTMADVPVWLMIALVIIAVTAISELASNTASAAMAIPVLASLAAALGAEPAPMLVAAALGASSGYALPVATPPNTIAYATGEVTVAQMVKAGALLDVVAITCMYAAVMLLVRVVL